MSKTLRVHLFLFLANLIYGISFTIAKDVVPLYVKPFGAIVIRVTVSGLLFLLITAFGTKEKIARKDWWLFILCGFFGVAANQLMFFQGLALTTPINASLVMVTTPILVLIFSVLFKDEKMNSLKLIGVLCGAAGAGTIILSHNEGSYNYKENLGDLFIFLNASCYAIYLVIVKPLMLKYSPITVISRVFLCGWLFVIPIGFHQFTLIDWQAMPVSIFFELSFIVIATTFFAYLLNILALKDAQPSVVGIYIYAQPLLATGFALILGKDTFSIMHGIAALLIFTGVFLVSKNSFFNKS